MPTKRKPEPNPLQLELFPGFDPRQVLFDFTPRRAEPEAPVRVVELEPDDFDRYDAITGPMNARIWDAECGT